MDKEEWNNHTRNLQAKMVEFSTKNRVTPTWIEAWLGMFSEAGDSLHDLRDLADILLEYQRQNNIPNSDMGRFIEWLCDEAVLSNVDHGKKEYKQR